MAGRYISLPLYNDTYYKYSVVLEDNTYILGFLYLERINQWIYYLKDSEGNSLVSGERLTPNTQLLLSYANPNLTGFLLFTPKSNVDPEVVKDNIRQISDFYDLFYIYDDGE